MMSVTTDPQLRKALKALAEMVELYCQGYPQQSGSYLDSLCMSPGQLAFELLAEHGLLKMADDMARRAHWTDAGRELLAEPIMFDVGQ